MIGMIDLPAGSCFHQSCGEMIFPNAGFFRSHEDFSGRYVGISAREDDGSDFKKRLEELEVLNVEARELEERIAGNVVELLG